jgi:magnesium transporter
MRDIYDHLTQVMDTIEMFRDMMSAMLEVYVSNISNKLNEVMKILTIISTIFIPLTFVTSLYGMNFRYMPEIGWKYGYAMTWLIIAAIIIIMLSYFRRKKWF